MVHPKRLNKIKLEDVIAILTLSLFQLKLLLYCIEFSFTVTFIISTLIIKINQINIMQTIKGNYKYR